MAEPAIDEGQDWEDLGEDFEEGQEEQQEPEPLPEVSKEARARAMGWKPFAEYRGDPANWTDMDTFIARGEEHLPILRDQNRRMAERLARLEPEVEGMRRTIGEQTEAVKAAMTLARRANEQGYQRALSELKAKQRSAAQVGDLEVFDQVGQELEALETTRAEVLAEPPAPREEPPTAPRREIWPETRAFLAANPWFANEADLNRAMTVAHAAVLELNPGVGRAESFEIAKAQVRQAFPGRIPEDPMPRNDPPPNQPRRAPSRAAVLTPSAPPSPRRPGSSPFDQIADPTERAEAKKAFETVKRYDEKATAEEYVALYLDPHADVLAIRAQRK